MCSLEKNLDELKKSPENKLRLQMKYVGLVPSQSFRLDYKKENVFGCYFIKLFELLIRLSFVTKRKLIFAIAWTI